MVKVHSAFQDMPMVDKVEFFLQCQRLLVEHHPNSVFVCRRDNLKERLVHMKKFCQDYKGRCYMDENVCALYNQIVISDPKEPVLAVRDNMYKASDPNYNAVVVDFVVFRNIKDCAELVKITYDKRIQYVVFVKNNKIKLYPVVNLLAQIFNMAVV